MIKVTPNKRKRMFTLRWNNKVHKTRKLTNYEFEVAYFYDNKHWINYLKFNNLK